ncbi:MAG TPA: peptidylprolyl isomerase [Prosthecobacter sp.]|nr:peptidylprolyl isomerase [Prosthecobacter sp.]HRK15972.1 peptidylprolyl isomerase [Prosthecobacter sp.]
MKTLLFSLALLAALLALRAWRAERKPAAWDPLPALAWRHGGESQAARAGAAFHEQVRALRLADTSFQHQADTAPEMAVWRRQFQSEEERLHRLTCAGLDEAAFESDLREHLLDEAWIEHHLARAASAVDEAAARAWHQKHRERLRIPEAHRAAHIFLSRHGGKSDRLAEITALRQRLQNGESWETLASAHSEDARTRARGGDLGWFTAARMPAEFMLALQSLTPGQTSAPVQTRLGWHLIRLQARRPARVPAFEEVRQEILAALQSEARVRALEGLR